MTIATQTAPRRLEEAFDGKDREEIRRIINNLHDTYEERLHHAQHDYHQAQRSANRASHEVHRLERHLDRITTFCNKHNIELGA